MHSIKLYGLTTTSNSSVGLTGGYASKTEVNGIASKIVTLEVLYLRPDENLVSEVKTGAGRVKLNDAIFRKGFSIESIPLLREGWDILRNDLVQLFKYSYHYIGIESFDYVPYENFTSGLVMPVVLSAWEKIETNTLYNQIQIELEAKYDI